MINNLYFLIRYIKFRPMLRRLKLKRNLIGAEIGVWYGENAEVILKKLSIKKLYLIDNYFLDEEYLNDEISKRMFNEDFNKVRKSAIKRLDKYSNISWIFKKSIEAYKEIKEPLDFVYIDGNHRYENVVEDILNYFSLVKIGGMIGGHDIENIDVIKAVRDCSIKLNQEINIIAPDWWFVKK